MRTDYRHHGGHDGVIAVRGASVNRGGPPVEVGLRADRLVHKEVVRAGLPVPTEVLRLAGEDRVDGQHYRQCGGCGCPQQPGGAVDLGGYLREDAEDDRRHESVQLLQHEPVGGGVEQVHRAALAADSEQVDRRMAEAIQAVASKWNITHSGGLCARDEAPGHDVDGGASKGVRDDQVDSALPRLLGHGLQLATVAGREVRQLAEKGIVLAGEHLPLADRHGRRESVAGCLRHDRWHGQKHGVLRGELVAVPGSLGD
mmetsp:Transcript_125260/g.362414  ORF Transcript_125260/g.362414 Transcript_125260/m.362414 type:complete len:257 (+) Transcript_125260:637-1407(+)